jgi:ketosteroid isomerase-like protein
MFRKNLAPGLVGIILLACIGFAIGFTISYGWIQIPSSAQAAALIPLGSDKDNDGLNGPVSKVQTETAKLLLKSGKLAEGPRELLELTTYDNQGKRVDSSYYLVSINSQAGREEYAHDDKGNVSEMTLRDNNNNVLSKAVYTYEYDAVGNWTKMITSTVVYEGGKVTRQPTEITYRNITYYFDQAIAEIVKLNPTSTETPSNEQSAQGDLASLRDALNGWIAATNARDLEGLMKFYSPKLEAFYHVQNVSQEFVRADKTRSFKRVDSMEVGASDPEITMSSDERTATMRFRKSYAVKIGGRERRGEIPQLLRWQRTNDGWKIVDERDTRLLRRD